MRWFGESWGAPVCVDNDHASTPVGKRCMRCDIVVVDGDRGVIIPHITKLNGTGLTQKREGPWHLSCWLGELGITEYGREVE